jgi:predicted PurR-regulated permease PerM
MLPPTPKNHEPSRTLGLRGKNALARVKGAASDPKRVALFILIALLVYGAYEVFRPFAASIILGAWAAHLSRPLFFRTSRALGGREKAAAVLTLALLVMLVAPFVLALTTLIPAARALLEELRGASGGRDILSALVSGDAKSGGKLDLVGLAKDYGAGASKALGMLASASADVLIGAFVCFATFYALLVQGERAYAYLEERGPFRPEVTKRMSNAFYEAGRGLLVGTGLTALVQGVLCGITYAILGVPRAVLLGLLSVVGALIPITGPAIIWVPVAAGLALTGHPGKAAILVAISLALVGTVDNVMRPWLSKRAHVGLSATVVLIAIFGGMVAFGPWGLLLGPLVVRLAKEALEIARDNDLFARRDKSSGNALGHAS